MHRVCGVGGNEMWENMDVCVSSVSGGNRNTALSQQGASNLCGRGNIRSQPEVAVSRSSLRYQNSGQTE